MANGALCARRRGENRSDRLTSDGLVVVLLLGAGTEVEQGVVAVMMGGFFASVHVTLMVKSKDLSSRTNPKIPIFRAKALLVPKTGQKNSCETRTHACAGRRAHVEAGHD